MQRFSLRTLLFTVFGLWAFLSTPALALAIGEQYRGNSFGLKNVFQRPEDKQLFVGSAEVDARAAGSGVTPLPRIVGQVISNILALIAIVFFILMLYAGVRWMTARGNEDQVKSAVTTIYAAIIGMIIVMGAYALTNFVTGSPQNQCSVDSLDDCTGARPNSACGSGGTCAAIGGQGGDSKLLCGCVVPEQSGESGLPGSNVQVTPGSCVDVTGCEDQGEGFCDADDECYFDEALDVCRYRNITCRQYDNNRDTCILNGVVETETICEWQPR